MLATYLPAPGWKTFEDDDDYVHLLPVYGRAHECSPYCWCRPESDSYHRDLIVHNTEQ